MACDWLPYAAAAGLRTSEVGLWRVPLEPPEAIVQQLFELLAPDEQTRAGRFYFPHLTTRFIAARGALRCLLSTAAGLPPDALAFDYTQHGKPVLPGTNLRFNLSHAHKLALIAISPGREIGVDIEHRRPLPDAEAIARRFFSPTEVDAFLTVPEKDRTAAFFNGWTRKEAYIKAIGDGLTFPLHQFAVTLRPGEPARLLAVHTAPGEVERWTLQAIDPGPGYTAALIAEGKDWSLKCRHFDFKAALTAAQRTT